MTAAASLAVRGSYGGASKKIAAYPVGRPVLPEDLARTIYHAMGIHQQQLEHTGLSGRLPGDSIPLTIE